MLDTEASSSFISIFFRPKSEVEQFLCSGKGNTYLLERNCDQVLGTAFHQVLAQSHWVYMGSDEIEMVIQLRYTFRMGGADLIYRKVEVLNLLTNETFVDEADVLITARGNLNNIKWPEIEGLDTFKGKLLHSAAWDERYILQGPQSRDTRLTREVTTIQTRQ